MIAEYGSEDAIIEKDGRVISLEETQKRISDYLLLTDVVDEVDVQYDESF